jgi:ParB-like chromosome segregation protein Spo0J
MTIEFPCLAAKLVDASKVIANDYNPNAVASPEMDLLEHSIREDGVTQPVVTFYDAEADVYVVVDGFHRYTVLTKRLKCKQIPVVVIDKTIENRMASTIRHNRARGKHKVDLMSDMVTKLLKLGWKDIDIANHLGMTAEEVLRLKQMTGLAGLFDGQPYSKAWESFDG